MTIKRACLLVLTAFSASLAPDLRSHEIPRDIASSLPGPAPIPLPNVSEAKGPVRTPPQLPEAQSIRTSGQGFWTFMPHTNGVMAVPDEAKSFVKGAHGTIVVDADRDVAYWGLEKVGWISFSDKLSRSRVIHGDPVFASGNLHGADIMTRQGSLPMVVVADNVRGDVYLSDTSFQHAQSLSWPANGPYKTQSEYHPTDAAFAGANEIYVTDGYGLAYFMPVGASPFQYKGAFLGGKGMSQTPHGITFEPHRKTLLLSARPEGQIKNWSLEHHDWVDVQGLPAGSTVCDVDLWGDYALAPCLDGPKGSPGPIYILNLKKKTIAAIIRPKEDLGYADAQHIHDAAWYFTGKGRKKEIYILFTSWNPGGIGALKLVQAKR